MRVIIVFLFLVLFAGKCGGPGHSSKKRAVEKHKNLSKKVIGKIAYNNPEYLVVGKPSIIEVRLSRNMLINLKKDFEGKGEIIIDQLRITNRVRVKLVCTDDVFIEAIEPEEQALDDDSFTLWTWKVVPQSAGMKIIKIRVGLANLDRIDSSLPKFIPGKSFEVSVKANLPYTLKKFVKSYWQWMITTFFAPLFIYFFNLIFKKSNPTKNKRRKIKTADGKKVVLAPIWKRFLALLIDVNLLCLISYLLIRIFINIFPGEYGLLFMFSFFSLLSYLYFVMVTVLTKKSLGKFAMNIKVISSTGNKLTIYNILVRELSRWLSLPFMGFLWYEGNLLNQEAWDMFGKTYVIESK